MAEKQPVDSTVKLYMVGDSSVGKTCLMLRFSGGTFTTEFISTIGIDFKYKTIIIDQKRVKVQIWDTAGQERFRTITSSYLRGAEGIILVYDVTDARSFVTIGEWMEQIKMHAVEGVVVVLVGNKIDLDSERAVATEKGQALADLHGIRFYETSAKHSVNVENVFIDTAREILKRPVVQRAASGRILQIDKGEEKPPRGGCC